VCCRVRIKKETSYRVKRILFFENDVAKLPNKISLSIDQFNWCISTATDNDLILLSEKDVPLSKPDLL
jgi:hypothetical protein